MRFIFDGAVVSLLSGPGHHIVDVEIDGQPLKGSPFTCNVYNVEKIKVTGLGTAKVSER